jgi:hypothetical protein
MTALQLGRSADPSRATAPKRRGPEPARRPVLQGLGPARRLGPPVRVLPTLRSMRRLVSSCPTLRRLRRSIPLRRRGRRASLPPPYQAPPLAPPAAAWWAERGGACVEASGGACRSGGREATRTCAPNVRAERMPCNERRCAAAATPGVAAAPRRTRLGSRRPAARQRHTPLASAWPVYPSPLRPARPGPARGARRAASCVAAVRRREELRARGCSSPAGRAELERQRPAGARTPPLTAAAVTGVGRPVRESRRRGTYTCVGGPER